MQGVPHRELCGGLVLPRVGLAVEARRQVQPRSTGPGYPAGESDKLADSTARWADAEESDTDADMSGLGGLPAAQGGAGHEAVREAWRAFTLSEGLTLAHVDALREAILRKVATFTAAEGGASSDSTPEVQGSVQGVATAAPRTSRSAVGGRRR